MKIALAQLNYHIGNFSDNTRKIIEQIEKAKKSGVDLVVFSELAISGYPPRDFLEFKDFIEKCNTAIDEVASHCHGITAIVGTPVFNDSKKGKPLYNAAAFLADGKVQEYVYKTLLPNYDIFDEYRYFEPNHTFKTITFKGHKIALNICEDLWNVQDNPLYTVNPMDEVVDQNPDFIINIAASPFNYHQIDIRTEVLERNARKYNLPLFYVNHVGAQTELLFDGGSLVMDRQGNILDEMKYFEEDFQVYDLEDVLKGKRDRGVTNTRPEIGMIHDALVM
jgi:NAD+ synthase (glutamine-hydrolysing)